MLFQFKSTNENFVVKEELGFKPSGKGDVFFVNFQKTGENTMDIIHHLCYGLKLERKELGIAGLKDKNAITEQRISIYKSVLNRIGGEKKFLEVLGKKTKILNTIRHEKPLAVGKNKGNHFTIKLESKSHINEEIKQKIEDNIKKIQEKGFPNCFGKQRFGKGYRNFYRSKEIFEQEKSSPLQRGTQGVQKNNNFEIRFKLQAYASMHFNEYTMNRRKKGQIFLGGDIMVNKNNAFGAKVGIYDQGKVVLFDYKKCKEDFESENIIQPYYISGEIVNLKNKNNEWIPTGPMLGFNMLTPPIDSKAYFRDIELIKKTEYESLGIKIAKKYKIYGFRRPLWTIPKNLKYSREENKKDKFKKDLVLSFFLPTGSYATVFLGVIFDGIDEKTVVENGLEIPLIK